MNKQRILELIRIMRSRTDIEHKLTIRDLMSELEKKAIKVSDRKTFYDDFRYLEEHGLVVENDNGRYYLEEAPFSLAEIKILTDSLNSLKDLDDRFTNELKDKLYSFVSEYETKDLKKLEYQTKHANKHLIHRLEDTLEAIRQHKAILIKRQNKDREEIVPLFLYRQNDRYYLYYHYPQKEKLYHLRFDHIDDISITDHTDDLSIGRSAIHAYIEESTNAFYSAKTRTIRFLILQDSETLRNRLMDDFPNLIFTDKGFSIKASVNNVFFAKLAAYGTEIKISDEDIAEEYHNYLSAIIGNNGKNINT